MDLDNIGIEIDGTEPESKDIVKCLATLYSTKEGTVPLDREFGLNCDFVGKPLPVAKNELAIEITMKTEKYEKRVRVTEVTFSYNEKEGILTPLVHLERGVQ